MDWSFAWFGTRLSHTNTKPMPSGLLQEALNVRSIVENEINREFTDIDNLIPASIESGEKPKPFDLLRLLRPPALARPKPTLAHRGAGP
jgi:hypothetical protein